MELLKKPARGSLFWLKASRNELPKSAKAREITRLALDSRDALDASLVVNACLLRFIYII